MTEQSATAPTTYRIGAVARLTGVAADTLRVWERRYGAVSPQRSARGGRLYSPDDVARLRLMKHLVEAGDAISTVATLGLDALRARVADARSLPLPPGNADDETPVRVLLVGESLAAAVRSAPGGLPGITPVATYRDLADFEARAEKQAAQVLVVEMATLHEDSGARIIEWLGRAGAAHALIVYRYASADALLRLPAWKCLALRAPVDAVTLEAHCLAIGRAAVRRAAGRDYQTTPHARCGQRVCLTDGCCAASRTRPHRAGRLVAACRHWAFGYAWPGHWSAADGARGAPSPTPTTRWPESSRARSRSTQFWRSRRSRTGISLVVKAP